MYSYVSPVLKSWTAEIGRPTTPEQSVAKLHNGWQIVAIDLGRCRSRSMTTRLLAQTLHHRAPAWIGTQWMLRT